MERKMSNLLELINKLKDKVLQRERPEEPKEPERSDFDKALDFLRPIEGFVSNDPKDTGGLTIYGISSKSHKEAVLVMLKLIEAGKKEKAYEIAKNIYYEVYWLKPGCDKLPFPFNIVVFDTAVNCGGGTASKLLAIYGGDWRDYLIRRMEYYTECATASEHMWGWARRLAKLYHFVKDKQ